MQLPAKSIVSGVFFAFVILLLQGTEPADAKVKKDKDKKKLELKVKVGDPAPEFNGIDETGQPVKSSAIVGKKTVVLFFYPSDFTGNGVAQVRGYQEEIDNLNKLGAIVLGISGDSPATHKLFKTYYKLPFTLIADEKGDIAKTFGVPVGPGGKTPTISTKDEKGSADRAVTLAPVTIVIDKAGKVLAADAVGMAGADAKRVADLIKKNAK